MLAFVVLESQLVDWPGAEALAATMVDGWSWLVVLGAFMAVSRIAERWAESGASPQIQYLGLGLYVIAEAIIFLPLLYIAARFGSPDVIPSAGIITGLLFGGLTLVAFTSGRDFSFLGGMLKVGA